MLTHVQDWSKLRRYSNDFAQIGPVISSVMPSSFVYTHPLLSLVSKITYTVSSGTLNSSIPYHPLLSTAQQACDTWKSTTSIRNIDVFHRRCIRRKIVARPHCQRGNYEKSRDAWRVTNSENSQMRQAGHLLGMPESRTTSVVLNRLPETSRRSRDRPHTWRLTFSEDLQKLKITWTGTNRVAMWPKPISQCPLRDRRN